MKSSFERGQSSELEALQCNVKLLHKREGEDAAAVWFHLETENRTVQEKKDPYSSESGCDFCVGVERKTSKHEI